LSDWESRVPETVEMRASVDTDRAIPATRTVELVAHQFQPSRVVD
jgi:hypothetical protein